MTKLMTAYLVFEALAAGEIRLETRFPVSVKAWRKGGSRMFLEPNSRVRVADLLRGLIVQSGNDAAIVLAEGLAADEATFADRMTRTAKRLGLRGSFFVNATGWPDPAHVSTARDIARLSAHLIADFPQYYAVFAERSFTWNEIEQKNRNPVLGLVTGADGLKTGHTEMGGYGVAASAVQSGRRLILVINGLNSTQARRQEAVSLLRWGFDQLNATIPDHPVRRKPSRLTDHGAPQANRTVAPAALGALRPRHKPAPHGVHTGRL